MPLPHPATAGHLPPANPVAGPQQATASIVDKPFEAGAEGALHGLADADGYLQRLRASLAAEVDSQGQPSALSRPGELILRREWAGADLADRLIATPERVTLRIAGVAGYVSRDSSGCAAVFQDLAVAATGGALEAPPSACPAEADDALVLAASWAALARPDLIEGLRIEAFQAAEDVTLRLAMPAWHLRWLVTLSHRAELRGIDLPARQLTMRWGPDAEGRRTALVHRKGQLIWRWQLGPAAGQAQHWQVAAPVDQAVLTSWAAIGPLGDAMQQALTGAQQPRVGAMAVELHQVTGGYRVKGLRAPVLASAQAALPAGLALAASRPAGAVLAQGDPAKQTPAQLLAGRTEACLLVTVAVPHPGLRGDPAQLIVQACAANLR